MKQILFFFPISLFLAFGLSIPFSLAQNTQGLATKSDLQYIISKFKGINLSAGNSQLEKIPLYDESAEGASILVYKSAEFINKLLVTYYSETGKSVQEYYFDKAGIIFVYIQNFTYNSPIYWNNEHLDSTSTEDFFDFKKSEISENRFYFKSQKLIKWIDENGLSISNDDVRFQVKESIVLEDTNHLISKVTID